MSKVQGGELMLFLNGKSIAFATNHELNIDTDTSDFSCKDEGDCGWSNEEIDMFNWSVTSENVFSLNGEGNDYEDLFDLMLERTPIDAVFNKKSESGCNVPTGGWTPSDKPYKGKVIITDLSLTAEHGEYATFSATFTGVGELINESKMQYLWFTPIETATRFKFTKNQPVDVDIEYSMDSGATWNYLQSGEASPLVSVGQKIYWRGNLGVQTFHYTEDEVLMEDMGIGTFDVTEYALGTNAPLFNVGGDPNSLLTYDFYKLYDLKPYIYAFVNLFKNSHVYDSSQMIFRDIKLSQYCYSHMFSSCLQMVTTVDELPSQQLERYCYDAMYSNCSFLAKAPELPAKKTVWGTYMWMFNNCKRLTESPRLVAQDLGFACYVNMFKGCSNLERIYLDVKDIDTHVFDYSNSNPFGNWLQDAALCGMIVGKSGNNWIDNDSILSEMYIPDNWIVTTVEGSFNNYDIKLYNSLNRELSTPYIRWDTERQVVLDYPPISFKSYKYGNLMARGNVKVLPYQWKTLYNGRTDVYYYTAGSGETYTQQITEAQFDLSKLLVPFDNGIYVVILDYDTNKPIYYERIEVVGEAL